MNTWRHLIDSKFYIENMKINAILSVFFTIRGRVGVVHERTNLFSESFFRLSLVVHRPRGNDKRALTLIFQIYIPDAEVM